MGAAASISEGFLWSVNKLTPDLDEIYRSAADSSLDDWTLKQQALVGGSGAAAFAVPGLHVAGILADVAFLVNRMSVAAHGTGAILARQAGFGNILEKEDFAAVLGYWSGDETVQVAMQGKGAVGGAAVATKLGGKVASKTFMKGVLASAGYMVGYQVGGRAMAKAGSKFAAKAGGKLLGGFVPFLGPIVSGGVNVWLISDIIKHSNRFYQDKINLLR